MLRDLEPCVSENDRNSDPLDLTDESGDLTFQEVTGITFSSPGALASHLIFTHPSFSPLANISPRPSSEPRPRGDAEDSSDSDLPRL